MRENYSSQFQGWQILIILWKIWLSLRRGLSHHFGWILNSYGRGNMLLLLIECSSKNGKKKTKEHNFFRQNESFNFAEINGNYALQLHVRTKMLWNNSSKHNRSTENLISKRLSSIIRTTKISLKIISQSDSHFSEWYELYPSVKLLQNGNLSRNFLHTQT